MRKLTLFILAVLIVNLAAVSAGDFTLTTENYNTDICRGSTATITTQVNGAGSFTASAKGTAGAFTTSVPNSFNIGSGGQQSIYSYVNPPSTAKEGAYSLVLEVTGDGQTKAETYNLNVKDCHGSSISVDIGSRLSCSCEKTVYNVKLQNDGQYTETYDLSVEGSAAKWTNLSTNLVGLAPGERREFTATASPACDVVGSYDLIFKAKSRNSLSSSTTTTALEIKPCYEYSLVLPSDNVTVCEGKKTEVPIVLRNTGTANNTFKLNVNGPTWAYFNVSSVNAAASGDAVVNLTLAPAKNTDGKSVEVNIEALSDTGSVKKVTLLKAAVETCYSVVMETKKRDYICNFDQSYSYDINVTNLGKSNDNVELKLDAPNWMSLADSNLIIPTKEQRATRLNVDVPIRIGLGEYTATVNAKSENGAVDSISKLIVLAEASECYKSELESAEKELKVGIENGKTFTLNLKNNGLDEATYLIELSGNATGISTINPTKVKIAPGNEEKLYLYVSAPLFTELGDKDLTVVARAKGTDVKSSVILNVNVQDQNASASDEAGEPSSESKPGFFSRLWASFLSLFKGKEKASKEAVENNTKLSDNLVESNASEILTGATVSAAQESTPAENSSLNESVVEESNVSLEAETPSLDENATLTSDEPANGTVEETNISTTAAIEVNDALSDNNSTARSNLENLTASAESSVKKFGWKENEKYIIGATAIVATVLLLITGLGKKILDFFEDE